MINKTEPLIMILTGGIIYFYFEILVRGYSHISMFLLGGVCFFTVGKLGNIILKSKMNLRSRILLIMITATIIITLLELLTGVVVNIYMGLSVWDYSMMRFNVLGQVCLLYSMLWAILGLPCVYLYGMIKRFVLEGSG